MKRFNQNEKEETQYPLFFKKNVFVFLITILAFFNEKSHFWRKYLSEFYKAK